MAFLLGTCLSPQRGFQRKAVESKVSEEITQEEANAIRDPHAIPNLPKVNVKPISECYAQEEANAANAEGIKLVIGAMNPNKNPNEPEVDIVNYLMTNPRTGEIMDYAASRMMYG